VIDLTTLEPPKTPLSPSLLWVLQCAFSTPAALPSGADSDASTWHLAERLGLAERIASRVANNDLPAASRDRFHHALVRSTATALMYEGVARELSTIAGKARIPLSF